jgi:2-methylcitrate dehydratase PrpD
MDAINQGTDRKVAERLGDWIVATEEAKFPAVCVEMARKLVLDVIGLCVAARREDYIGATLSTLDRRPPGATSCTAFGHDMALGAYDAALVNGTAAHGEDYDDTFEGGPVHSGAVIVPAMMALCERERLDGAALLRGIVVGTEIQCRLGLVAPKAIHKAGFHPTAVLGTLAVAGAAAAALRLPFDQAVSGIGIAGSTASGIIEYLAEGTWTKRMHAGWSAQAGLRAALMARGGFLGPRSVLEGTHGFFQAFAPSRKPDFTKLLDGLGEEWVMPSIAFKPYACGTMTQPYIDCGIALAARGVTAGEIADIVCKVGEGTVHRLWEVLADKHRPATPYAAKFSTPFCMAVGFLDGRAGFEQFTEARIHNPAVLELTAKIHYVVDPANEYPDNFTGHLRATLKDGTVHEIDRGHMRGGARQPLSAAEVEAKFMDNARYGGWSEARATGLRDYAASLFQQTSLAGLAAFRA